MVARDPSQQAQAYVDQGLDYFDEGNVEASLQCLERALQVDPDHGQAWYCKGTILGDLDRYTDAIGCYEHSVRCAPDFAHLPLFNMGNAYQELQLYDQALDCFERATEVNPEMADAWINRGRLLDDRGDHVEAIQCYDRALEIDANDPMAWTNRGNSLVGMGDFQRAQQSYQLALDVDPGDALARLGVAICVARLENPAKGLEMIDQIRELAGTTPYLVERATILAQLERFDEALSTIDSALATGGELPEVWTNRGEILARLEQPTEALSSFEQALGQDSHFAAAWFGKARLLFSVEQPDDAAQCLYRYFDCAGASDSNYHAAEQLCEMIGLVPENELDSSAQVIPGASLPAIRCACCQQPVDVCEGRVEQEGESLATYWAQLPKSHNGLFFLAVQLHQALTDCPRLMILQADASPEGITLWIMDLEDSPWSSFEGIKVLSREEGLQDGHKDQFFALADLINVSDPRLKDFVDQYLD